MRLEPVLNPPSAPTSPQFPSSRPPSSQLVDRLVLLVTSPHFINLVVRGHRIFPSCHVNLYLVLPYNWSASLGPMTPILQFFYLSSFHAVIESFYLIYSSYSSSPHHYSSRVHSLTPLLTPAPFPLLLLTLLFISQDGSGIPTPIPSCNSSEPQRPLVPTHLTSSVRTRDQTSVLPRDTLRTMRGIFSLVGRLVQGASEWGCG